MQIKSIGAFLIFICLSQFAQARYQLHGFVEEKESSEAIIGAVVHCLETKQNTTTNNFGYYSLALNGGDYTIVYSYGGYYTDTLRITLTSSLENNVLLEKLGANSSNKKQLDSEENADKGKTVGNQQTIQSNKVKKLPLLLGEVDVIKAAQLLPGVKNGTEGSSGFYVRGGGRGQNLVLLDGVPIYNQNHLFGFFSVFNNSSLNGMQIYKGSFPARFGGRLSSVLDVSLKEGNTNQIQGSASIGPVMARLNIDGPLSKDGRTTFAVSGRRSYIDLLLRPIFNAGSADSAGLGLDFYFYDFNAKVNHRIDKDNRLYFSYYQSKDVFGLRTNFTDSFRGSLQDLRSEIGLNWVSNTALARYTRVQKNGIFANYSASFTRYKLRTYTNIESTSTNDTNTTNWHFRQGFRSSLSDVNLLAEYDYKPSTNHHLRYGASSTFHIFKPGIRDLDVKFGGLVEDTTYGSNQNMNTIENAIFIEDVFQINEGTKANIGLRLMHYGTEGKQYLFPEPRLALNEELDSHWILRLSYALTNQPIHLLANSNTGIPIDIWAPATANIRPQSGHQLSLGLNGNLGKGYRFIGEVYYRWLRNALDYAPGANFLDVQTDWQTKVLQGNGENYGLELFLQKNLGDLTGSASYTYSQATRTINGINNGRKYPFRYDQRHNISTAWNYQFSDRQSLGFTGVFATGFPITVPVGQYQDLDGNIVFEYGSKNNYRMSNFFRIDLNYVVHKKKSKLRYAKDVWYNFSIYNATAYPNPFLYQIERRSGSNGVTLSKFTLFRFLPSLSYNVAF